MKGRRRDKVRSKGEEERGREGRKERRRERKGKYVGERGGRQRLLIALWA